MTVWPRVAVVAGVPVDDVTLSEAVGLVMDMAVAGRRDGRTRQVATVNVDFIVNAIADPSVRELLASSDLSIPDGMPVVWAARWLGTPLRGRTAGADLVPALAMACAAAGRRLVLFGGAPGVADAAADRLRADAEGLDVVTVVGDVAADGATDADVLARLREAQADVLCVALGNPKQERWIRRFGSEVGAGVAIGVGGTLDFLAGRTRRAPAWMRDAGLEWLHRAISEPRRLARRYVRDAGVYAPAVLRQRLRGRQRGPRVVPTVERRDGESWVTADHALADLALPPLDPDLNGRTVVIAAGADATDNVTVSVLARIERAARFAGATVVRRD